MYDVAGAVCLKFVIVKNFISNLRSIVVMLKLNFYSLKNVSKVTQLCSLRIVCNFSRKFETLYFINNNFFISEKWTRLIFSFWSNISKNFIQNLIRFSLSVPKCFSKISQNFTEHFSTILRTIY